MSYGKSLFDVSTYAWFDFTWDTAKKQKVTFFSLFFSFEPIWAEWEHWTRIETVNMNANTVHLVMENNRWKCIQNDRHVKTWVESRFKLALEEDEFFE